MRKHYSPAQRAELMSLVATGRARPREAAARLGVPESTAYYWLRVAARRAAPAAPRTALARIPAPAAPAPPPMFARLVRASEAARPQPPLVVRVGSATLEVRAGFDAALLREVVAALAERAP